MSKSIREQWMGEHGPKRLFGVIALAALILTAVLYACWGSDAFILLGVTFMASVFYLTYRSVGGKVDSLMARARAAGEDPMPALIYRDFLEAPGVVSVKDDRLAFHQLVGGDFSLTRADIVSFKEGGSFHSSLARGKIGFVFKTSTKTRLSVAVPASSAQALRDFLCRKSMSQKP